MNALTLNLFWFVVLTMWGAYSVVVRSRSSFWATPEMKSISLNYLFFFIALSLLSCAAIYGVLTRKKWAAQPTQSLNVGLALSFWLISFYTFFILNLGFRLAFLNTSAAIALVSTIFAAALFTQKGKLSCN